MDWGFVIHHLISGVLPVAAALTLYFVLLRALGKRPGAGHAAGSFLFCFYLVGILTMTGVCLRGSFSPRIVYIPFVDMIRGPVDTALNILLFVPMGVFLPLLYGGFDRLRRIALAGFLVSFSVEAAQMFGSGATDINDLITNTLGACLGYGLYKSLRRAVPKAWIEQTRIEGPLCFLEPLLFWAGSLLCMLTVQIPIFHALFSGRMTGGELQLWE
jgi:glycopeptide antibiotics resistance protein